MNQFIQHMPLQTKAILVDGQSGTPTEQLIIADNASFINDTKTGGRTIAFWLKINTFDTAQIQNLIQARRLDYNNAGVFSGGIFYKHPTETSNEQRIGIYFRSGGVNRVCFGSTTLSAESTYLFTISTTGSAYRLGVNAVQDTINLSTAYPGLNNGNWFGDTGQTMARCTIGSNTPATGGTTDCNHIWIAYWDKNLSDDEVTELYNSGNVKDPRHLYTALGQLQCYYEMGEREDRVGSIATIYDSIIPANLSSLNMTMSKNS
jgi:hypothetical protein